MVLLAAGGGHLKAQVKGESLRTLVSHNPCLLQVQREAAACARLRASSSGRAVRGGAGRCDGLVGGGGEVGVFQPGPLLLMRVTQQAP